MAELYGKLCGHRLVNLLWHIPVGVIDRSYSPNLAHADRDRVATLTVTIVEHIAPKTPKLPYRIAAMQGDEQLMINLFNAKGDYLAKQYPIDKQVVVSGTLERRHGVWNMNHPRFRAASRSCQ